MDYDLTLYAASGAIMTAPFLASAMQRSRGWMFVSREPLVGAGIVARYAVAAASLGAGAIHLVVAGDEYGVSLLTGLLMSAVGSFQLIWPPLALLAARRSLDIAAVAVNAGALAAWALSRTIGLPSPIGDGGVEPVGSLDLVATSLELVVVIGVMAALVAGHRLSRAVVSTRSASLAVGAIGVIVIVLVTASLAGGVPQGH